MCQKYVCDDIVYNIRTQIFSEKHVHDNFKDKHILNCTFMITLLMKDIHFGNKRDNIIKNKRIKSYARDNINKVKKHSRLLS